MSKKFTKKDIKRSKTLGERLRKVREEAGKTLEEAETATQINRKYLLALEESKYNLLPGRVYIESFLRRYAQFLEVSPEFVLDLFDQEKKVLKQQISEDKTRTVQKVPKDIITPKLIRNVIVAMIIIGCLFYLGWEVKKIVAPPILEVSSPADYVTLDEKAVTIKGSTEPAATVLINGQEIFLDSEGNFLEELDLQEGMNIIKITAQKKRSKESVVLRNIFVETE